MSRTSITFNGITKPYLFKLRGDKRPWFAPKRRDLVSVPGRSGAYLSKSETEPLRFPVPVGITGITDDKLQSIKEEIGEWLLTDEVKPLKFGDEPNRTYYAVFENSVEDFERIASIGSGWLYVLCPDPFKYGQELFDALVNDTTIFDNPGTEKSKPVFEATVLQDIAFAQITNSKGEYIMVGKAAPIDQPVVSPYNTVFSNSCSSTVGWSVGTTLDSGDIVGAMGVDNGMFVATDYGVGSGWHGPAIKQSLPNPIQDFNIQAMIEFKPTAPNEMGRIEIHGLDIDNNIICLLSMFDTYPNITDSVGRMRIGNAITGKYIFSDRRKEWRSFYGRLALQRKGNTLTASIQYFDKATGKYMYGLSGKLEDVNNEFQTLLAQIQVHIATYGTYSPVNRMAVDQLQVLQFNNVGDNEVPMLARVGDKLVFDHQNAIVYLNGEDIKKEKDFGATYFPIHPGENQLFSFPEGALDTTVKWRPAYK